MKPRYFFVNYDKLVKEIKHPKIIFSNDLMPFLENFSSESFLIYQVDFSKVNGRTTKNIKKPIHSLHPKVNKLNFKKPESLSEYDRCIPKIIKELNIPDKQCRWRWCSKKKDTAYILQECEIEELSQEKRFFLYCYHTLREENKKIKEINKEKIYKLKSKNKIEQYIHRKQYALENLAKRLIKEINPVNSSSLYQISNKYSRTDCLKITYISLEKLHRFIEKEYRNYLNVNSQIPYRSIFVKEFELSKKLKVVKSRLLESNVNDQLLQLLYDPLLKIGKINIQEKLTYYEFNYCSEFILVLHDLFESKIITNDVITECLFDLNFNTLQFLNHLTSCIVQELEIQENDIQKIDILYRMLKTNNQMHCRSFIKYKANLPSIKEQIIIWIEEEIEYLTKKIKLEGNQISLIAGNEEKVKISTGLSVAQLSGFFRLLEETDIITHKNHTGIFRFMAENIKTNKTDKISIDSIKQKFYNMETSTKEVLKQKIIRMLELLKN